MDIRSTVAGLKFNAPTSKWASANGFATSKDKLEYLADSPEFLTQTIDAIGYRDRLDNAFQRAIARAKGLSDIYEGLRKLG